MIPALAVISASFSLVLLVFNLYAGFLSTVALKSIMDAAWYFSLGPLRNIGSVFIVLAIILIFRHMLVDKKRTEWQPVLKFFWILYILDILMVCLHIMLSSPIGGIEIFFRMINGPLGWFILPFIIKDNKDFKRLMLCFIIGAIPPCIYSFLHVATGLQVHERVSMGLQRVVGVYHDAVVYRIYVFPGLLSLWMYSRYYMKSKRALERLFMLLLLTAFLVTLYKVYSKGVFMTLALWFILFTLHRRHIFLTVLTVITVVTINYATQDLMMEEYSTIFGKETAVLSGETERTDIALSGRIGMWEHLWNLYKDKPFLEKVIGSGGNVAAHNEFFRHLIVHGFIGLFIYSMLFLVISFKLFFSYIRERSDMAFLAIMVWVQYFVEVMGQTPSGFSNYQWYVFGIVSLYFSGFRPESDSQGP